MSQLSEALVDLLACTPEAFEAVGANLKSEWVLDALTGGGPDKVALMRRRKMPIDRALWMVVGMGLFRDRSIQEVVEHLGLSISRPGPRGGIAPSAIPQARERLGPEPVQRLFERTAKVWAHQVAEEERWNGLSLWGMDGTTLRIPDTAENDAAFGRSKGSFGSGSGYPSLRLVSLVALHGHAVAGMTIGGFYDGELTLMEPLWEKLPDGSVTILDRGLLSWGPMHRLQRTGKERHWLIRAKKSLSAKVKRSLGPGDELVEISTSDKSREKDPGLPETFEARVISYQIPGFRPAQLVTSMTDAEKYPAKQIAELYHQRWEIELAFDEVKTHMLERQETLRSRTPRGINQELAGIGIAYNLVRVEMARVARELGLPANRISFRHALLLVRGFCLSAWATSPGALPRRLGSYDNDMRLLVLPERRPQRSFPRAVKTTHTPYPRKPRKSAPAA